MLKYRTGNKKSGTTLMFLISYSVLLIYLFLILCLRLFLLLHQFYRVGYHHLCCGFIAKFYFNGIARKIECA